MKKCVSIQEVPIIHEESLDIAELLHLARISDWTQRQADKCRMEKLLSPIFAHEHRQKILHRNFESSVFKVI